MTLDLLVFAILALAVYRLSRLVIIDVVFEKVRDKIWSKYPPSHGIGYLITCYWCTSVWVASVVTICYTMVPTVTVYICLPFALSAVAGLIAARLDV
jgi:hypothetical protein